MQTIYLQQQPLQVDAADLIQAGGEGMVFRLNNTAVKLYHRPTPNHQDKLDYLFTSGLAFQLPPAVLAPCAPVTNAQQKVIGFQMPLLPPHSLPCKQLANPLFRQKHPIIPATAVSLWQQVHTTLTQLHQLGIIIGDLNDTNLFFTSAVWPTAQPAFIDADSYQVGHFPCPVAMPAFLDPHLYGVTDFSARPYFSEHTDWYAFTVLLVKSLLGVHPYGGTHPQYKSLPARAQAGVSILDTAVTLPPNALPLDTLSPDLLHHLHRVFARGERPSFPASLLAHAFRRQAAGGRQLAFRRQPLPAIGSHEKALVTTNGLIEHVTMLPHGRIVIILYEANRYTLVRLGIGGKLTETTLFTGTPGARFALFGGRYLAVNAAHRPQLLILDVDGSQPQTVTMIETAAFRDTAVFAATAQHLYRLAGSWIMRGSVQNGHYVEEAIATAHKNQTWFQASPYSEAIAGYHRVFAEYRFFVQTDRGNFDLDLPPLAAGEHIADVGLAFGRDTVAVGLKVKGHGRVHTQAQVFSLAGQLVDTWQEPADTLEALINHYPLTPRSASEPASKLWQHPHGVLCQEPSRLLFYAQVEASA